MPAKIRRCPRLKVARLQLDESGARLIARPRPRAGDKVGWVERVSAHRHISHLTQAERQSASIKTKAPRLLSQRQFPSATIRASQSNCDFNAPQAESCSK